ncbi:MAG: tetratricopeptide repeat protein, partial [Magnetococcales bacterium]|nr:tetratricopeptide repeat protein [Magnetococcales bacterium]
YNLGDALHKQGKLDSAVASYQKSITLNPNFADAHRNLGVVLKEQGKLAAAVESYKKAITIDPNFTDAYYNLGSSFKAQGKLPEAVESYQKAITLKPDYAEAFNNLGCTLIEQGELKDAASNLKKAVAIKPDYAEAYYNYSAAKKFVDISEIELMQTVLSKTTDLENKEFLNFAIGKALVDIKQYSEAFNYFIAGNRIKRAKIEFNSADEAKNFAKIKKAFNSSLFESNTDSGCKDKTPIFILGMVRSGSTLIEQILSSHGDVYGGGELAFIEQCLLEITKLKQAESISDIVSSLTADDLRRMGNQYIERVRNLEPSSKFITDKMPGNFLYIGLIKLILPNAKIIHSVRSAEDTCLSIFRTRFSGVHNYAYELTELGEYYRLYFDIMTHWQELFSEDIYNINYEELIKNQEGESRKLLDFCGLEWDDRCLNFHKSARGVKTASSYQVRQPLYSSSVDGWRRFKNQLQPLTKALGDLASK